MANRMRNFQSPGFPHNLFQKLLPAAETRCIDASRRQLQSVIKDYGLKYFLKKIWLFYFTYERFQTFTLCNCPIVMMVP
jgi:hypothetical protein